jgi:penicillin-binding protein 1A
MLRAISKFVFTFILVTGLTAAACGMLVGIYFYFRFTSDLPKIEKISDYKPAAVSTVLDKNGKMIAEIYDERRYPVSFEEIPQIVKFAFLSAEDSSFYTHPGIDITSIIRAFWINIRHKSSSQGASTITQQVVKSLLLSREKTYERKAKEAILSYRLEKALTKDEIFSIYLNEVFLGSGAYGVKAAALAHFNKNLNEINVAEAAYLAGLPQRPSEYSKPSNRKLAIGRQRYTLGQMLKNKFITDDEYQEALKTKLEIFPQNNQRIFAAPYYATHVIGEVDAILQSISPGLTASHPGGYTIKTALNLEATNSAQLELQRGLREVDKRRGWRGPLKRLTPKEVENLVKSSEFLNTGPLLPDTLYQAVVFKVGPKAGEVQVQVGTNPGVVDLSKAGWAKKLLDKRDHAQFINPAQQIRPGDLIEVSLADDKPADGAGIIAFKLDQTPEIEGALVTLNPLTGDVEVMVGGYDFQKSVFNRATQALLQPGSAFKPFVYLSAIDVLGLTPASLVPDTPISLVAGNGQIWEPQNYDRKYLGPITLRVALQRSRNVVSVHLLRRIGVQRVIDIARKMGLTTPLAPNLSLSLGTSEVKLIELARAYGVFSAGGWLADSITISSITDRDGKVIYQKLPHHEKVIEEDSAFLMANMMKGVVERGTAQVVKKLEKPVAGKTGTTNGQMDAWFIGYTPDWVTGVWVGFDVKRGIGDKETGGRVAAPIFLNFMKDFLKDTPPLDFEIPDNVVPFPIDPESGRLVDAGTPGAFIEYFKSGTEPTQNMMDFEVEQDYLQNEDF